MKAPTVKIDGKTYAALSPRISAWRKLIKIKSSQIDLDSEEGLDMMIDFFVDVFNNKSVNAEAIEENVAIEDFFMFFQECGFWIEHKLHEKMSQVPEKNE